MRAGSRVLVYLKRDIMVPGTLRARIGTDCIIELDWPPPKTSNYPLSRGTTKRISIHKNRVSPLRKPSERRGCCVSPLNNKDMKSHLNKRGGTLDEGRR